MPQIPSDPSVLSQSSPNEPSRSGQSIVNSDRPDWSVLAHVLRPQGRRGEVLAELYSDFPEQFEAGKRVFLAKKDFTGPADEARTVKISSYFLPVGKNAGRIVLHFEGITSIEAAESLAGLDVLIPTNELPELDDDANYVSDLVGCTLFDRIDDGLTMEVGTVTGIEFATTPDGGRRLEEAAPLLIVLTSAGEEVLVPYVKAFLVLLDAKTKRIEMTLPRGLLEINR